VVDLINGPRARKGSDWNRNSGSHCKNRKVNLERGERGLREIETIRFDCGLAARMRCRHPHVSASIFHLPAAGTLRRCERRSRHCARHRRDEQRQQHQRNCCYSTKRVHSLLGYVDCAEERNPGSGIISHSSPRGVPVALGEFREGGFEALGSLEDGRKQVADFTKAG
jgi:hypothetical protein